MFDRIASVLIAPRRALQLVDASEVLDSAALRTEVATLFQSDLEDFTRLAMDRRARKAGRGHALAA